jgi:two-component system chemotaxis response regulator CheB
MRSLLRSVLCSDLSLEIAGSAADGESALAMVESLRPDLVLLDVEMQAVDGLLTLRRLRAAGHRMPVIMCSGATQRGARVTIEALAGGATDYVAKPAGQASAAEARQTLARDLLPKIQALVHASQPLPAPPRSKPLAPPACAPPTLAAALSSPLVNRRGARAVHPPPLPLASPPAVLAIGVSTGGPAALDILLPALPADFPLPVLIVQHMPELFTRLLAERLDQICPLRVREAAEGDAVCPGSIFIARGNWHLEVRAAARAGLPAPLHHSQAPPENHCRPAVDVLFRSAAAVYGSGVLALVLTGMGSDGLAGARILRALGGVLLAQDESTSAVWGMPGAVAHAGLAQRVLPLSSLAPEILRIVSRAQIEASELRESLV